MYSSFISQRSWIEKVLFHTCLGELKMKGPCSVHWWWYLKMKYLQRNQYARKAPRTSQFNSWPINILFYRNSNMNLRRQSTKNVVATIAVMSNAMSSWAAEDTRPQFPFSVNSVDRKEDNDTSRWVLPTQRAHYLIECSFLNARVAVHSWLYFSWVHYSFGTWHMECTVARKI